MASRRARTYGGANGDSASTSFYARGVIAGGQVSRNGAVARAQPTVFLTSIRVPTPKRTVVVDDGGVTVSGSLSAAMAGRPVTSRRAKVVIPTAGGACGPAHRRPVFITGRKDWWLANYKERTSTL